MKNAVIAGLVFFILLISYISYKPTPTDLKLPNPIITSSIVPKNKSAFVDQRLSAIRKQYTSPSFEELEGYLNSSGRTAPALTAVYFMTGDRRALDELRTLKNDTVARTTLLIAPGTTAQDRLRLSESLILDDPENALGYILGAKASQDLNRNDKAADLVAQAMRKTSLKTYELEITLEARAAWKTLGHDPISATMASYAAGSPVQYISDPILDVAKQTWRNTTQDGSDDAKINAATNMLRFASFFNGVPSQQSPFWISNGQMLQADLLKQLPPEIPYGDGGETVGMRLKAIRTKQYEQNDLVKSAMSKLSECHPSLVDDYFNRVDHFGEHEAAKWLMQHK